MTAKRGGCARSADLRGAGGVRREARAIGVAGRLFADDHAFGHERGSSLPSDVDSPRSALLSPGMDDGEADRLSAAERLRYCSESVVAGKHHGLVCRGVELGIWRAVEHGPRVTKEATMAKESKISFSREHTS